MRIDEIESRDDKIRTLISTYFRYNDYKIDDNGHVYMIGNCKLLRPIKKLPFKISKVKGDFDCSEIGLLSLVNSPNSIDGDFFCYDNKLTSLKNGPKTVGGTYSATNNKLTSLIGVSKIIMGHFLCAENPLINFDGISELIDGECILPYNENLPLLKLLFVKNITRIGFQEEWGRHVMKDVSDILNKYLGQGRKGALQCAAELTKAGFKGNAKT